jgi:hypothetical protein
MDFDLLWQLYPRKVSKKPARMLWERMTEDQQAEILEALPNHIDYWEAIDQPKEFIPHLRTWLYQERWTDEIELPKPKEVQDTWWTSEQGIERKAKELGINPRPGESWFEVKGRINDAIRKAA